MYIKKYPFRNVGVFLLIIFLVYLQYEQFYKGRTLWQGTRTAIRFTTTKESINFNTTKQ